jgi:hypothetical protein
MLIKGKYRQATIDLLIVSDSIVNCRHALIFYGIVR